MDEDEIMETEEIEQDEDDDDQEEEEDHDNDNGEGVGVYIPGRGRLLKPGEKLECDLSAYKVLHQLGTGAPCLSFDIINDININNVNNSESIQYPLTLSMVAGTQAASTHINNVIIMKVSNLCQNKQEKDDDEDDDSDSDSDEESDDDKPVLSYASIKHSGCVNRLRVTPFRNSTLAASWSELGQVNIWNITQQLQAVDNPILLEKYNKDNIENTVKPLFTFTGHQLEGFAIDWCKTELGVLATGDCRRDIHIWKPDESGSWKVDQRPLVGHTNSVEDIQWSPNEKNVLASCSVDKSIRIWDTRAPPHKACMLTTENAHNHDVNVISWNRNEPFIASGGDDGLLHVWDLRQFQTGKPSVSFKHHIAPVSSVEWHPTESSVLASAGEDHQVALWDLAVEKDDAEDMSEELKDLPPQLLFIHQGQTDIKELHWHPQIPGLMLTTANTGFNIFKTISV